MRREEGGQGDRPAHSTTTFGAVRGAPSPRTTERTPDSFKLSQLVVQHVQQRRTSDAVQAMPSRYEQGH
jgi:hypothetical protein